MNTAVLGRENVMLGSASERSPGFKLLLTLAVGFVLTIPLFSVYLLAYDRQSQMREATETVVENGQSVTRSRQVNRELTLAPEVVELKSDVVPQVRKRSIYRAVVYDAKVSGKARFAFPQDLSRTGVEPASMDLTRAELRFGLTDPRGL